MQEAKERGFTKFSQIDRYIQSKMGGIFKRRSMSKEKNEGVTKKKDKKNKKKV